MLNIVRRMRYKLPCYFCGAKVKAKSNAARGAYSTKYEPVGCANCVRRQDGKTLILRRRHRKDDAKNIMARIVRYFCDDDENDVNIVIER